MRFKEGIDAELLIDLHHLLDGYGAADGWRASGARRTRVPGWLGEDPEADYLV